MFRAPSRSAATRRSRTCTRPPSRPSTGKTTSSTPFIWERVGSATARSCVPHPPSASSNLRVGRRLRYHFDPEDDWTHDVKVKAVGDPAPDVKYPRVVRRVGESPPQYTDGRRGRRPRGGAGPPAGRRGRREPADRRNAPEGGRIRQGHRGVHAGHRKRPEGGRRVRGPGAGLPGAGRPGRSAGAGDASTEAEALHQGSRRRAMTKTARNDYPIHDLLKRRWSPRAFADRPVEPDKLPRCWRRPLGAVVVQRAAVGLRRRHARPAGRFRPPARLPHRVQPGLGEGGPGADADLRPSHLRPQRPTQPPRLSTTSAWRWPTSPCRPRPRGWPFIRWPASCRKGPRRVRRAGRVGAGRRRRHRLPRRPGRAAEGSARANSRRRPEAAAVVRVHRRLGAAVAAAAAKSPPD